MKERLGLENLEFVHSVVGPPLCIVVQFIVQVRFYLVVLNMAFTVTQNVMNSNYSFHVPCQPGPSYSFAIAT